MGVILRKEVQMNPLTTTIAGTIAHDMQSALVKPPPAGLEEAEKQAEAMVMSCAKKTAQVAAHPPTKITINWQPFLISLGLFFVLLAIAIVLDWQNMVDDPKTYSGMVTTVLGIVLGFLTGDAVGTAMSEGEDTTGIA